MEIQVSVHDWLALPMRVRLKLREVFAIPKSQGTIVENNTVKSDGTTFNDLQHITLEKMKAYLGTDGDFVELFNLCVEKLAEEDRELEPTEKIDPTQALLEEWAMTLTRMQKQAESLGLQDHFATLIRRLYPNENARPKEAKKGKPGRKAK